MSYIAKALGIAWGCDTSEVLTSAQAKAIAAAHLTFIVRTVPLAGQSASFGISAAELAALTDTGLGVMLYQNSRVSGWSASTGQQDGQTAAEFALARGYPKTASLFCDLSPTSITTMTAYVNAWVSAAIAAGMSPSALGLYCEPGVSFDAQQLYELSVQRYWRPGGQAPAVQSRGYAMYQAWKGNQILVPGIVVDYDMCCEDYEGGECVAAFPG